MTHNRLLGNISDITQLAERLARISRIRRYDDKARNEAGSVAVCLADCEGSFIEILDKHLPRLVKDNLTDEEVEDVLFEIGFELRHIAYHVRSTKYYTSSLFDSFSKTEDEGSKG